MSRNLSIVEAKTHLSDCIREVERRADAGAGRTGGDVKVLEDLRSRSRGEGKQQQGCNNSRWKSQVATE